MERQESKIKRTKAVIGRVRKVVPGTMYWVTPRGSVYFGNPKLGKAS